MTIDQLINITKLYPDDALAHYSLGSKYYDLGKTHLGLAQEHLEKALTIDARHIASYYILGNVLADLNKTTEAKAIYLKALSIIPSLKAGEGQDLEPNIRDALESLDF